MKPLIIEPKECEVAWSWNRKLISTYDGPIYQVRRADGEYADVDENQCVFGTKIRIREWMKGEEPNPCKMYDQSGNGRHLTV